MKMFKLMFSMALVVGLTLALAGMANAAPMSACGGCHGTTGSQDPMPNNVDNCNGNARGLHGTHVNYSSSTFKKTVASYGKCAYCHKSVTTKAPTLTHNTGYVNITGNDSGGKATGLDYVFGSKTCTNACHRNTGSANSKWGNYTATTVGGIKLDCNSCHDDSVNKFSAGSGVNKHNKHLLSNCTTPQGVLMSATVNAGCVNCHPNATGDLWLNGKADDGTKKVYPHAQDGTNVVADNANVVSGQITAATKAGVSTTCTNACHARGTQPNWSAAQDCNMCHYYAATPLDTNNTGTGSVSTGHNSHFKTPGQFACTICHPSGSYTDGAHASRVPAQTWNAKVVKTSMTYNLPAKTCTASGTGCHGAGTSPAWGTTGAGCNACHKYPGGTTDWAANDGHAVKYSTAVASNTHLRDNASFSKTADTLAAIDDLTKCGKCHAGAAHNNGVTNVTASGSADCGGPNFTIVVTTTGSNVTCTNVSCHSGKVTPNWW